MSWSDEVHGIIAAVRATGVLHRVTDIGGPGHARSSYHYRLGTHGVGLAVDLAGPVPSWDSDQLADVYEALEPFGHCCAELVYSGPGGGYWKNGRRVPPYATSTHHNHVHVAVPVGTVLRAPTAVQEVIVVPDPIDNPDVPNISGPVGFEFFVQPGTGVCIGYYMYSVSTGEIHGWGPGAPYHGRSEDPTPGG